MADWDEKVVQVKLSRLEDMFPEIWQKRTVHVSQTNPDEVKKVGETGSFLHTIFPKMFGVQAKVSRLFALAEGQNVHVTDDLLLEAIAANRNRLLYNPHVCPACNMMFKNKGRLMMHLEAHIIEKSLGNKSKVVSEMKKKKALGVHNVDARGRQYLCYICDDVYMSEKELVDHKLTHFMENFRCTECELTFRTTIYLNIHIESVHSFNNRRKSSSEKSPKNSAVQLQSIKRKSDSSKLMGKVKAIKQK